MPFEMECALAVARKYWASSSEVRRAFDDAADRIAADWTEAGPDLRSEQFPLNHRREPFSEGVLVYRYVYQDDATPRIKILAWEPPR